MILLSPLSADFLEPGFPKHTYGFILKLTLPDPVFLLFSYFELFSFLSDLLSANLSFRMFFAP